MLDRARADHEVLDLVVFDQMKARDGHSWLLEVLSYLLRFDHVYVDLRLFVR